MKFRIILFTQIRSITGLGELILDLKSERKKWNREKQVFENEE